MAGIISREWEDFVQSGCIHDGLTAFDVHEARRLYFSGAAGMVQALVRIAQESGGDATAVIEAVQEIADDVQDFSDQMLAGHA